MAFFSIFSADDIESLPLIVAYRRAVTQLKDFDPKDKASHILRRPADCTVDRVWRQFVLTSALSTLYGSPRIWNGSHKEPIEIGHTGEMKETINMRSNFLVYALDVDLAVDLE